MEIYLLHIFIMLNITMKFPVKANNKVKFYESTNKAFVIILYKIERIFSMITENSEQRWQLNH
jgi:hypothetical protein